MISVLRPGFIFLVNVEVSQEVKRGARKELSMSTGWLCFFQNAPVDSKSVSNACPHSLHFSFSFDTIASELLQSGSSFFPHSGQVKLFNFFLWTMTIIAAARKPEPKAINPAV